MQCFQIVRAFYYADGSEAIPALVCHKVKVTVIAVFKLTLVK